MRRPRALELFSNRAADLDVELSVCPPARFVSLLSTRQGRPEPSAPGPLTGGGHP